MALAGEAAYEFQCLHGMGEALYGRVVNGEGYGLPCRIYAPVGEYRDLLAYLVRRLLENGANTSFVNRLVDDKLPIDDIVADPVARVRALATVRHPRIPLPAHLYGDSRRNSAGVDLSDTPALEKLCDSIAAARRHDWRAAPLLAAGRSSSDDVRAVTNPANRREQVGTAVHAGAADVDAALAAAERFARDWDHAPAAQRAAILERAADLFETHRDELMALCLYEAGKTLNDGIAEVREAADFLRYYAMQARSDFSAPLVLPGPTGERNEISLHGRGPFVCISPWNFPLAIFTGQVSAALAAGNPVLAKPAEQTPLVAARGVELMHEAGVPRAALQLLPGDGATVGARLIDDPRIAGVAFTGSVETAHLIARGLARREGPIVPLIAETGGQNAMIVDSTALPEQVVRDVVISAFQSAGQRCSASRILCLQTDIAPAVLEMLEGAMAELVTGDPADLATDVGPVIDEEAQRILQEHVGRFRPRARRVLYAPEAVGSRSGVFFPPVAMEIDSLRQLEREVFGPVLHVVRFPSAGLEALVDEINATRYGLTLGVHSRIDGTLRRVRARARVGNLYANRSMIGAVVGVQPFGGEGLSGTGPKAGGPRYLYRFATERSLSVDTTAAGGNASLMALEES
jgi:RHH-type proline utilization regulon transcriptional repressor/proline dehydrogenase/delta 1-pyrroline-5-carboxylate dehydrogenase